MIKHEDYIASLSPQMQQAIAEKAQQLQQAYQISQLRQSANITQKELAEKMGVSQANISKIENGKDVYLSTLKRYIATLGGEIRIQAKMPNGENIIIA